MIEWYIRSADDDATCPNCLQFTLRRMSVMKELWVCDCGYSDNGVPIDGAPNLNTNK